MTSYMDTAKFSWVPVRDATYEIRLLGHKAVNKLHEYRHSVGFAFNTAAGPKSPGPFPAIGIDLVVPRYNITVYSKRACNHVGHNWLV